MSGSSELNPARSKGHRVRFEQSWVELSSSLRKRTAQRRSAITESERSDSEWLYRSSSGSESTAHPELSHKRNPVNSNGQTPAAGRPAHTSAGILVEGEDGIRGLLLQQHSYPEKRVFAPPKMAVPVEQRRQRTHQLDDIGLPLDLVDLPAIISLPLELTDQDKVVVVESELQSTHSMVVSDPVRTLELIHSQSKGKVIDSRCGFFRQILSEDEVIYDMPNNNKASPELLPVEEAVYAEPSMHSMYSSTITSFGEQRAIFSVFHPSGHVVDMEESTSHYADPFERCSSLPEHEYEEMDHDTEDYHQHSLPFAGQMESKENPESGVSVSSFSDSSNSGRPEGYLTSDSGASLTIPPGLARSRAALFESIAEANQRIIRPHGNKRLVQALGPQLALYSLSSLPLPALNKATTRSCPPSLNAINWSVDACAENDGFFMEFANQRMAIPQSISPVSSSSIQSSSEASSTETESSDRSKSSRKVSFIFSPKPSRLFYQNFVSQKTGQTLTTHKSKSSISTSSTSTTALNLARFFRQTFGGCGGEQSDTDSLLSHPADDLLSQSDLSMFCKPTSDNKRERKDSGTDVTTPDPSIYGSTLTDDIDAALANLEVKAKSGKVDRKNDKIIDVCSQSCASFDGSDFDSSSCSSSCSLTDCGWTSDSFTSSDEDSRIGATSPGVLADTSLDMTSSDTSRLDDPGSPTQPNDGKHSLLQFALYHFRQSPEKFEMLRHDDVNTLRTDNLSKSEKKKSKGKKSKDRPESSAGADWTWKEQVDLVKFTKSPIQASLLQLDSSELNKLALECFLSIMKYMGDYPMAKGQSEVDSVYTILMNCHKHETLRDETYCQIMKQTTNNKSSRPDSCQRGWRLFSITAAYFSCSEVLKPYLFKYLETAAYDKRRAYHGTAMVCLQNLRKTLRYGGRKNVPSIEEITAITAGRNSKRQMYRLPGGTERVINTKSTSVVQDIIEEICGVINVRSEQEMEEYSLYCIVEGDTFTMPLAREEYILDVTTELQKNQQVYYLIFCRSVWHYPMRLDNALYIEIVFNQIAPDYLEGLLLVMPGEQISQDCVYDIAKVAALLHRAADLDHMPTMKETKYLLPKPALSVRDIKPPQWVNLVQSSWKEVEHFKPSQAKAQVLEVLEKWSLFGSSFFAVRRDADPSERSEHILALNRNGVHFLDVMTHETLMHYPYSEVISTRKVKSEEGPLFLDMKCGNLMQQRVTRIQTDQAHEISRLIRQYITIQQRIQQQNVKEESNLASR